MSFFFFICFHDYLPVVKYNLGLPDTTEHDAFEETNIVEVELIESSPNLCLTVCDRIPDRGRYISL